MTRGTRRAAAGGGGDPRTPLEFARQKRSDIERTGPSIGLGHGSGSWSRFAWTEADPPGFLEVIDILMDFMRANYIKKTASLSQDEKAGLWYEDLEDGPNVGWAVELAREMKRHAFPTVCVYKSCSMCWLQPRLEIQSIQGR